MTHSSSVLWVKSRTSNKSKMVYRPNYLHSSAQMSIEHQWTNVNRCLFFRECTVWPIGCCVKSLDGMQHLCWARRRLKRRSECVDRWSWRASPRWVYGASVKVSPSIAAPHPSSVFLSPSLSNSLTDCQKNLTTMTKTTQMAAIEVIGKTRGIHYDFVALL